MSFLVTAPLLAGISRSHPTCPLPCHSVTWAPTGRVKLKYVCSAAVLKYKLKHYIIPPCLQLNTVQQMTLCPSSSQVYVPGQITGDGWVATDPWKGEMPSHSGWAWLVGGGIFQLVGWALELICRVEPESLGRSTYAPGASLAWRRIPLMAHKKTPWQVEKESLEKRESFIYF